MQSHNAVLRVTIIVNVTITKTIVETRTYVYNLSAFKVVLVDLKSRCWRNIPHCFGLGCKELKKIFCLLDLLIGVKELLLQLYYTNQ